MAATLSKTETLSLITLLGSSIAVLANTFQGDGAPVVASIAFSSLAFSVTYAFVRWSGSSFVKAGLKGKDLSKRDPKEIPESMGSVAAAVFILVLIAFIPFAFYKDIVAATTGGGNRDSMLFNPIAQIETGRYLHRFPHSKLSSYQSALNTLEATTILGLADDILDLRWRHKFFIPAVASLPLLIVYYVDFGVTSVVVPNALIRYMPQGVRIINLGVFYYAYMSALSIFAPNSINIFAGINGIEVGQSLVIAGLLVFNSSLYLVPFPGNPVLTNDANSTTYIAHPATDSHLLALYILLPFIAVSLALYIHNRYPARVFVGDTYCYVAGMTFAVVAILSHFSKTLLLLLIPQIFNFIYSTPQLFKLVPCPRHRLPRFNARTGLLEPSVTPWEEDKQPKPYLIKIFGILERFGLLQVARATMPAETSDGNANANGHLRKSSSVISLSSGTTSTPPRSASPRPGTTTLSGGKGRIISTSNLTIINLYLVHRGPLREDQLCRELLLLQAACGLAGLFIRHKLAIFLFGMDNRPIGGVWSLV
ncbi:tunicamycin resistance protein [Knufia fluminis]|uniref:UDP-N-acetylglucosamine--dolichyl-phosphate N-acetylglucosaminephosphotransferase n=1 Tax=Knufia fluminis TaxID=191047 RepID=A0AAN8I8U9_9EURO|nr:tunicamycin resistance protein [Knufia fluminis]